WLTPDSSGAGPSHSPAQQSLAGRSSGWHVVGAAAASGIAELLVHDKGEFVGLRYNAGSSGAFGQNFSDSADLRAHAFQLLFNALITAIYVINAVDNGFSIGH